MTKVKTLLLTRPRAQSVALAKELETRFPDKMEFVISPLIEITTTGSLPDLTSFDALIFTSVNGVNAFRELGGATDVRCYCVGERTKTAAASIGLDAVSADGAAAEVIAMVSNELAPESSVFHVRGEHSSGDVAQKLSDIGYHVEEAVVYRQTAVPLSSDALQGLSGGEIDFAPVYSPRTAEILASEISDTSAKTVTALCLSENVARKLQNTAFRAVEVSEEPTGSKMIELIGSFCAESR